MTQPVNTVTVCITDALSGGGFDFVATSNFDDAIVGQGWEQNPCRINTQFNRDDKVVVTDSVAFKNKHYIYPAETRKSRSLIGLAVYNSKGVLTGVVTDRYLDDKKEDVLLIDGTDDMGGYEIAVNCVSHVLWTLKPDYRMEHLREK